MSRYDMTERGMTAWQVVLQSACIHPDWDSTTQRVYLKVEAGFDAEVVDGLPVEDWLANRDHPGYVWPAVRHQLAAVGYTPTQIEERVKGR